MRRRKENPKEGHADSPVFVLNQLPELIACPLEALAPTLHCHHLYFGLVISKPMSAQSGKYCQEKKKTEKEKSIHTISKIWVRLEAIVVITENISTGDFKDVWQREVHQ